MAQTLSEGPVIPDADGGEQISATGVNELRTLGASTNAALASVRAAAVALAAEAEAAAAVAAQIGTDADATSRARDTALEGLIAGMEGMSYVGAWVSGTTYRVNDVVTHGGDSWARLTTGATGEPGVSSADWGLVARKGDGGGFGELSETATDGLYETVAPAPWSPPVPIDLGTAHLDTITTPGDYTQIFASRATKAQGYPHEGSAGILSVRAWNAANGYVIQTFTPWQSAAMAKRTKYSSGFQTWFGVNGSALP